MCAHVNVCAQTPLHACARFPVCLWDSSLSTSCPKCVCPNAATPGQEVLSCFICHDKKLCAVERKELAVTWVSFVLFSPINTSHPSRQLLSYPKRVVLARRPLIEGWLEKVQGLGKAKQIRLCLRLGGRGDQQGRPSVTESKISADTCHCMRPPSATAVPVGCEEPCEGCCSSPKAACPLLWAPQRVAPS